MNTAAITESITNDLMKYDIIRPFVDFYYKHPRLHKKFSQFIPLNFYFFNHDERYYYHYDPDEGDHGIYKKKIDLIHESITPVDCKYAVFQDLYLFLGFRKLGHKILPFFLNMKHDPNSIVDNDYYDIYGFATYDEKSKWFSDYTPINVSKFFTKDFKKIILRADGLHGNGLYGIPYDTSEIFINKKIDNFESCFTNILRIVRRQIKK